MKIVRDNKTGQFTEKELAGDESTNVETVEKLSPWLKEWVRIGKGIERYSAQPFNAAIQMDLLAVQAVIHIQVLKR
jgi:hypothetical protein